jgi:hypothetical protein
MINDAITKKAVYDLIRKYIKTEATVIWENQAEARPPKPYCSLLFITGTTRLGHDSEFVEGEKVKVKGMREMILSVNYFGTNAMAELSRVQTALGFPTAREMLLKDNIVFVTESGMRDLSALMENRFESRAQMDVRIRITDSDIDLDSTIVETVQLENDIDNSVVTLDITP